MPWHCPAEISSINVASRNVPVTHATGTDTLQYQCRCWLLKLALVTNWMVLFLFSPEDMMSMISETWNQNTLPLFCTNFIGTCCRQTQNECIFAKKKVYKFEYLVSVLYSIEYILKKDLQIIAFCFYLCFTQSPSSFGIGAVIILAIVFAGNSSISFTETSRRGKCVFRFIYPWRQLP